MNVSQILLFARRARGAWRVTTSSASMNWNQVRGSADALSAAKCGLLPCRLHQPTAFGPLQQPYCTSVTLSCFVALWHGSLGFAGTDDIYDGHDQGGNNHDHDGAEGRYECPIPVECRGDSKKHGGHQSRTY